MNDKTKLGMMMFILSEAVFFLLLIAAYAFYHQAQQTGPTAANTLDTLKTGIYSILLIASSGTFWLAERAHKNQKRGATSLWIFVTIALGATFLAGQTLEYLALLRDNITISTNLFGTTFYTLTGFHGLHVLIGLILLAVLLALSTLGRKTEPSHSAMGAVAIYWHFVDAVWIAVFAVVYLWKFF